MQFGMQDCIQNLFFVFIEGVEIKQFLTIFNMNQKVSGTIEGSNKLKDSKSQKTLKATVSPKLSTKQIASRKGGKREKSDKKVGQVKSKKQTQFLHQYFDKDEYNDGEQGNYQYYNNQAHDRINKKSTRKDKHISEYSKSKQASFETQNITKITGEGKKIQTSSNYNRLKLPESKGVITFDGKYVKAPAQEPTHQYNPHITYSNSNYTDMFYGERDTEIKKKKKKKEKSRNKTNEKKIKSKSKSKPRQQLKKKMGCLRDSIEMESIAIKRYKSKEKQECGDTEPSPGQSLPYQRRQFIDYDEIQQEISKEKAKIKKINLQKNSTSERMKCINMLSKISGELQFKKETFALSIKLLDGYLNEQIVGTKMKVIGIAALILALKIEEAESAATFQFQISTANTCNNNRQLRTSILAGERKSEGRSTSKKKIKKEQPSNKDKKVDIMYNRVTTLSNILIDEFPNESISKNQLLEFENLIALKLDYRIRYKTYAYWIDLLTIIWDQRLLALYPEMEKLLFRCPKFKINMSYLLQILEILQYDIQAYNYSEIALVLSVIYLLIRITMEEDPDGYDNYRKVLHKSSNALFVDNVGCNKLFGEFLQCLSMEMGEILQCCQFVSSYLLPSILKKHRLHGWVEWEDNYDFVLSIHMYNPELFRFCSK